MEFVRALKALADPQRLRILAAVSEEELTVGEVQEVVQSAQSSVSRNLSILRAAGFVQLGGLSGADPLLLVIDDVVLLQPRSESGLRLRFIHNQRLQSFHGSRMGRP